MKEMSTRYDRLDGRLLFNRIKAATEWQCLGTRGPVQTGALLGDVSCLAGAGAKM